jgi:PAS domain S-box-containing protein
MHDKDRRLFIGSVRDVSDRKAVELKFKQSEERLRFSQNFAGIASWEWNIQNDSLVWSDGVEHMFGLAEKSQRCIYSDYLDSVHPEDRGYVIDAMYGCIDEGVFFDVEHRIILPDQSVRWIHIRGNVVRDQKDHAVRMLSVVQDVTQRKEEGLQLENAYAELYESNNKLKEAQNQLLQSEKMASIGQLAAGVAHEINNPVGYISSNIGSLKKYLDDLISLLDAYEQAEEGIVMDDMKEKILKLKSEIEMEYLKDDIKELIEESLEGVSRVKKIVQDLKDFSHVDEAEWQWSDLHKGLDSTLNIVNNEIKYKAEVVKEYGDIPEVECLVSQLNQVFMNLLVNAAHAIEERGKIFIKTEVRDGGVAIEITDTGKGMPKEVQKRIFDPFYTTKPVGKGTGLGLSLSYGIMEKHHGFIIVESEEGKGTTFTMWLPISQEDVLMEQDVEIWTSNG